MEEKNKEVKMNVVKNEEKAENKEAKKLTYEQLNEACMQLYQQNQNLVKQVQQLNQNMAIKRLDYLFEVVRNSVAFDTVFVGKCVEEIQESLTLPEKSEEA